MTVSHTPDVRRNIERWAGRLPPAEIAYRLGLSPSFVERVAVLHKIDLRLDDTITAPLPPRRPKERPRHVNAYLSESDYQAVAAKCKEHNLREATLVTALLKGALSSGTFDSLVALGRKGLRK
jgi:hypothetical protein